MTDVMDRDMAEAVAVGSDAKMLPKRAGHRTMLPSTWVGRSLRIEYADASGKAAKTSATLLDWCPLGIVVDSFGAKTIIPFDRLVLVELRPD